MSSGPEEPIFSIGSVARMTGIPEATLRVWERRYPFPKSARTSGGHRLYSQHDVSRLQWVKERIDKGMQVSQAIRALHRAEQEGEGASARAGVSGYTAEAQTGVSLPEFQKRLLAALLEHDVKEADLILKEALMLHSLEHIVLEVIGPTLDGIGEAWAAGNADVATEHVASNYLRHHLLTWINTGPPAYAVSPVVLACAPGELHEGGLLMLAVLLRRLRWPVSYLGQSVPLADLPNFVESTRPSIVVLVAMTEESANALAGWPRHLAGVVEQRGVTVAYGGRAFVEDSRLIREVPGIYLGDTLQEGVQALNKMLHTLNPLLH